MNSEEINRKHPGRWSLFADRAIIWLLLVFSYGVLFAAAVHWLTDTWSGLVTLGMLFAIAIGAPTLAGYAGYLWRKGLHKTLRWEAALSVAFPIATLLLAALVINIGRIK